MSGFELEDEDRSGSLKEERVVSATSVMAKKLRFRDWTRTTGQRATSLLELEGGDKEGHGA